MVPAAAAGAIDIGKTTTGAADMGGVAVAGLACIGMALVEVTRGTADIIRV